jgi:hypothetical protein
MRTRRSGARLPPSRTPPASAETRASAFAFHDWVARVVAPAGGTPPLRPFGQNSTVCKPEAMVTLPRANGEVM